MTRFLAALAGAAELALPRGCLGCSRPGPAVCPSCWDAALRPQPWQPQPPPPGYPATWVAGNYAGVLRAAVLAGKERERGDVFPLLASALARAVARAATGPGPVLLVPVPSTRAAVRRRGGDHMRLLARRTAANLRRTGRAAGVLPVLELIRTPRDSAALTATERAANLAGAFAAVLDVRRLPAVARVVVVDDVVTTGTTLTQCAVALRAVGVAATAAAIAGTARLTASGCPGGDRGTSVGKHTL